LDSVRPILHRNPRIMKLSCNELMLGKILFCIELWQKHLSWWFFDERNVVVSGLWDVWLEIFEKIEVEDQASNYRAQTAHKSSTHDDCTTVIHGQLLYVYFGIVRPSSCAYFINLILILVLQILGCRNTNISFRIILLTSWRFPIELEHFALLYILTHKHFASLFSVMLLLMLRIFSISE